MPVNVIKKHECTGCHACCNACLNNCLHMERDEEGFLYPVVDSTKCTNCENCLCACPMVNESIETMNVEEPKVYAAWSLNDEIRINSTSGGVFSELALHIIKNGGYVCGARYGRNHHIEHSIVNTIEGLEAIRQSKYAQSDKAYIYREIKQLLLYGQKVLFCGTPCECAGLRNYLQNDYDNLIMVDFICRGANSPRVYERFLEYLENKYDSKCTKVWFKNKTYGWNRFSTKIEFANGNCYLKDRDHDPYILGYIKYNLYMRPSCAKCLFRTVRRSSDITLADFWGVKLSDPNLDIEKGTSMVMVNSSKGADIFEFIKPNIFHEKKTPEDVLKSNPCMWFSPRMNKKRGFFFKHLETKSFEGLIKECFKENILDLFKFIVKKMIRRVFKSPYEFLYKEGNMFRISVCSNHAEISEISEAWRNIYRENKELSPFQSYEWNKELIEYRIYKGKLNFIVLYKNNKPVIIAPFIRKNRLFYSKLTFIGEKTHSDYLDFIYYKNLEFEDFKYFITEILSNNNVIRLSDINEKSLTLEFLNRLKLLKTWYKQICIKIPIRVDEKDYLKTLSSNTRHTIKKEQNKIQKGVTDASFCFYVRENLEETIVRQVVDLYCKRQKERYHKCLDEKYIQYLSQAIKESNNIFLGACFIHGDLAACQLSLISQENNICGMVNAMNSAYKEYSLGIVLLYKTICYLIKENGNLNDDALKYKYYDLTRGNEEYKYKLGGVEHYNYNFTLWKNKKSLYIDGISRLANKCIKKCTNLLVNVFKHRRKF